MFFLSLSTFINQRSVCSIIFSGGRAFFYAQKICCINAEYLDYRGVMKNRRGFSIFEVAAVLVIVGLLVAVFLPASVKVREKAANDIINTNLNVLVTTARSYLGERNLPKIGYKTLVGEKIIKPLVPVKGESYEDIVVNANGGTITLKIPNSQEQVEFTY